MLYFVEIKNVERTHLFEFAEFKDAVEFIKLWELGCDIKCNYKITRSDI